MNGQKALSKKEFAKKWGWDLAHQDSDYDECLSDLNALLDEHYYPKEQQPTAEGAEEILEKHYKAHIKRIAFPKQVYAAMQEFATLHAQKMADKMVSERLRDEMLGYIDWLIHKGRIDEEITDEELIDQYLKSREWSMLDKERESLENSGLDKPINIEP